MVLSQAIASLETRKKTNTVAQKDMHYAATGEHSRNHAYAFTGAKTITYRFSQSDCINRCRKDNAAQMLQRVESLVALIKLSGK